MKRFWKASLLTAAALSMGSIAPAHAQSWTSNLFATEGGPGGPGALCMTPTGLAWGSGVVLGACAISVSSMNWHLEPLGVANNTLIYRISNNAGGTDGSGDGQGLCLEVTGTTDSTPVMVNGCYRSSSNQYWHWYTGPDARGYRMLRNYHTGLCLDVRNGGFFLGAVVQTFHCAPVSDGSQNLAQYWAWTR